MAEVLENAVAVAGREVIRQPPGKRAEGMVGAQGEPCKQSEEELQLLLKCRAVRLRGDLQ